MKILIVADREKNIFLPEALLRGSGFGVRQASKGTENCNLGRPRYR